MTDRAPASVLGTEITELSPSDAPALLISDLHVPEHGGQALAHLDLALAAARNRSARLFVLGDLFDSYVCPAQIEVGVWRDVALRFAAAAADGVAIDVLPGNRDFLLGPEFAAASRAQLHPGGIRLRLGGVDTLMVHGDELCQNDLPYQRAKRWLRSGLTRAIARRLPVRLALAAARGARKKSAAVIASGDQSRFLPTQGAVAAAFAIGVQRLVFGHIHRLATGPHGGGRPAAEQRRYWVLPAFDTSGIGFVSDPTGFGPVEFGGEAGRTVALPHPDPCPFPA